MAFKSVVSELLWFLEGSTDERRLAEIHYGKDRSELIGKKTIWGANADNEATRLGLVNTPIYKPLGPVYGCQWRNFNGVDQITNLIEGIKNNPDSRRHLVSAWNVSELNEMALPPCHYSFQMYVSNGKLSCLWNQRSVDSILGLPFNVASYALLTHMIAQVCDLEVGDLIFNGGDCHIYTNHVEGAKIQLGRTPMKAPKLWINPDVKNIFEFKMDDFKLENYHHHPKISFDMAV